MYKAQYKKVFKIAYKVSNCSTRNPRVMKTIRLHKPTMVPWILESDIKVLK